MKVIITMGIDKDLLRKQLNTLYTISISNDSTKDHIEGIISILEHIQDECEKEPVL